ncbi:MAG: RHS repeat-associated core domain-containing protein, partial [Sneathiella sp.]
VTDVLVNQKNEAGSWVSLGSYNLETASSHRVEFTDERLDGYDVIVTADAVKFVWDGPARADQETAAIVMDNTDVGTSSTGTWTNYGNVTWADYWGTNFAYKTNVADPAATFTWTPTLPKATSYGLYVHIPHRRNKTYSSVANYTVHHAGGSSVVTLNQGANQGKWLLLGHYDLAPGSNHRVILDDIGADARVVADAIKLEINEPIAGDFIVDNDQGTATGTSWVSGTSLNDGFFTGLNYQYVPSSDAAATFTWEPAIPAAKRYRLYATWTDDTDRATSVKYTVHHAGGTTEVLQNQRYNASTWMTLGEFEMVPGAGHKIVLSHDSLDGLMVADAVKFEVIDDLPSVVADAVKLISNDGEAVNYVHSDHLGAPTLMTDASRSVVWDRTQLPFGSEDSLTGSAANDNRFPGQREEAETGLHYNYFRDYDPTTGRYLQSDPIGLNGGINTYGYTGGNPVNYADPEGKVAHRVIFGGLIGAGFGLGAELYTNNGNWECVDWTNVAMWAAAGAGLPPGWRPGAAAGGAAWKAFKNASRSQKRASRYSPSSESAKNSSGNTQDAATKARNTPYQREYSSHANQRMKTRDQKMTTEVVESAIKNGHRRYNPATGKTTHNLPSSASLSGRGARVVTNSRGKVVTIIDMGTKFNPRR